MSEIGEEQIRWLLELLLPPLLEELNRVLQPLAERQNQLEKRLDSLASELQAVKDGVKTAALSTASEFVKYAVESAITAAGRGLTSQINVATEPVLSRLSSLDARIGRIEQLLNTSAEGIAKALEAGTMEMKRVSEEGVKAIKAETGKVANIASDLELVKKAVENLTRLVTSQKRETQVQLPPELMQKMDAILSAVTMLRERIKVVENRLDALASTRGESEKGGEVEV